MDSSYKKVSLIEEENNMLAHYDVIQRLMKNKVQVTVYTIDGSVCPGIITEHYDFHIMVHNSFYGEKAYISTTKITKIKFSGDVELNVMEDEQVK